MQEVARQLAELHREGRFHNDVCPRNILLDDLGAARLATHRALPDADDYNAAQGEHLVEIADYLAPEQALNSGRIDGRADIYSLGCTLYFLLVGQAPFPTGTITERLYKLQTAVPQPLGGIRADIPAALVDICETMMAKKPSDRYQSAEEVISDITRWLRSAR